MKRICELKVKALTEKLTDVLAFVDEVLEKAECPMKAQTQLDVAVEEVFVNIAHYAYAPGTGMASIRLETEENPPMIRITFMDRGIPFNPLEREDPDVTLSAAERSIGGLGIYMVKKSMDKVLYEHRDGQNILTIEKKF